MTVGPASGSGIGGRSGSSGVSSCSSVIVVAVGGSFVSVETGVAVVAAAGVSGAGAAVGVVVLGVGSSAAFVLSELVTAGVLAGAGVDPVPATAGSCVSVGVSADMVESEGRKVGREGGLNSARSSYRLLLLEGGYRSVSVQN